MSWSDAAVRAFNQGRRATLWTVLGAIVSIAVLSLGWLATRAVSEWQHSTVLLVDQRSEEALTLLTVALNRDMKGVHHSVLASFTEIALNFDQRYELEGLFAEAFARFPYPESFFVWKDGAVPASYVFNRVDRQPAWAAGAADESAYPVVSLASPAISRDLIEQVRAIGTTGRRFGSFDLPLGGTRYQVVVHLLYHTVGARPLLGAVGFMVNLDWVAKHYFDEILNQISRIGCVEESIYLAVLDGDHRVVASTGRGVMSGTPLHERTFGLSFLDPDLVDGRGQSLPYTAPWTLRVSAAEDPTLAAASLGSVRTRWLIVVSAAVALMGALFTLRALRASANLAAMQSEFVASATHELKTPLALFQLVAETLVKGRCQSQETSAAYGVMLQSHTQLLERLIDNLLSYGSLGHVARRYRLELLSIAEVTESALERFDARLAATGHDVVVEMPADPPRIRADRMAMLQVLDNVIDNALKYSPAGTELRVRATTTTGSVQLEVADQGIGIPQHEQEKVFQKFYRGRSVTSGGTGLGLAIARRVVEDHGGRISVRDGESGGTVVQIRLPAVPPSSRT